MASDSRVISVKYLDSGIDSIFADLPPSAPPFTCHFNQSEELFLKLDAEFEVPPLPIHHDIEKTEPNPDYLAGLKNFLGQISKLAPDIFSELTYFFDPGEIMKPSFYQLYKQEDNYYLYILKINLLFRVQDDVVIEKGTNDITPRYRTNHLFVEGLFIPLQDVSDHQEQQRSFAIRQTISDTWIGETGRGYFAQGIWIDDDLSKYFTKLFVPKGKRLYPFYPYVCQHKTVCRSSVKLSPVGRGESLPYFHKALSFLLPHIEDIQEDIKNSSFSEDLPSFQTLRSQVPVEWVEVFRPIQVALYLNENDMREFSIEY